MNISLFNFFFSLSTNHVVAWSSLFVSNILTYILIILAIIIPILIRRDYIYSILVFCSGAGAWIIAYFIKNIFLIPRPFVTLHLVPLFTETGFSFPSSHVTVMATLSVVIWNINRKLGVVFFVSTILVAFSRIIIGVHYPLDVLAGICFGVLIGLCVLWFYRKTHQLAFLRKYS